MIEHGLSGGTLLGNVFSYLLLLRCHVHIFAPVNLGGLIGRVIGAGIGPRRSNPLGFRQRRGPFRYHRHTQ
jgi:hypothetical protein